MDSTEAPPPSLWSVALNSGPVMMITSSALFAVMGVLVKLAGAEAPPSHVVFWRSVFSLVPLLPLAARDARVVRPNAVWPLVARSLAGVGSMFCYFTAISRLPLGDAVVMSYASPLWVALFGPVLIGEASTPGLWRALWVGFLGVALVAQPSLHGDPLGVAAAMTTSVLAGIAYLYVRVATRTERSDTIVFWFGVISALVFLPFVVLAPRSYGVVTWLELAATGGVAMLAQLAMTRGYALGAASRMSIYAYATPVFAYGGGLLVLGEPPGWRGIAGTALVAFAGSLAVRAKPPV